MLGALDLAAFESKRESLISFPDVPTLSKRSSVVTYYNPGYAPLMP
ncbi:unnamed protein product, partial [Amoebophrya sp. A25]|eukprot:GSA25T00020552001.1